MTPIKDAGTIVPFEPLARFPMIALQGTLLPIRSALPMSDEWGY